MAMWSEDERILKANKILKAYFETKNFKKTARKTGISLSTVKSYLFKPIPELESICKTTFSDKEKRMLDDLVGGSDNTQEQAKVQAEPGEPVESEERIEGDEITKRIYEHMDSEIVDYETFKEIFPKILQRIGILQGKIEYDKKKKVLYYEKEKLFGVLKKTKPGLRPEALRLTVQAYLDKSKIQISSQLTKKKDEKSKRSQASKKKKGH